MHVWFTCPGHVLVLSLLFLDVTIPFFTAPRTDHCAAHVASILGMLQLEYILLHASEINQRLSQFSFLLISQVH